MNGLLVRVGIDSTDGRWNAPVRLGTKEFAYVTITEEKPLRSGMGRLFDEFGSAVARFGQTLPGALSGRPTHLDPDFSKLTYGDQGQRARRISSTVSSGDLLVFFASFQPVDGPERPLVYALIGLYVVDEIVPARSIPQGRWEENAHTRRIPDTSDIVVRAKPGVSGRLSKCIPIGELRRRAYRVSEDVLNAWGGLGVRDGYIQRSGTLPAFDDAERFYRWFLEQKPTLNAENNPL
jgi:hypothetical protein